MKLSKNNYKVFHGGLAHEFLSELSKQERWRWEKRTTTGSMSLPKQRSLTFNFYILPFISLKIRLAIVACFFYNESINHFWEMALFIR